MTIDTAGQTREGGAWYQPFSYALCGHLDDVMLSGSSACASGNASKLYTGASRYVRHIAFVEGGYVISIDDITGTGAGTHKFDWRLHKAGTWTTGQLGEYIVADSLNMRLDIRFLEPAASAIQGSFLPAELTAQPCVQARVTAASTRITAVLVPQHNSQPVLTSAMLSATGATAVEVQGNGSDDVFAVNSGTTGFTAGTIQSDATLALVRKQGNKVTFAEMTRGASLVVSGKTLLRSIALCNLSWRGDSSIVTVEAEPAYKATGGADTVTVGGLMSSRNYSVSISGTYAGSATANASGEVRIPVNLQNRVVIRLAEGVEVEKSGAGIANGRKFLGRQTQSGMEFIVSGIQTQSLRLRIFNTAGRMIWRWDGTVSGIGPQKILWPGAGMDGRKASAGVYVARVSDGNGVPALPFVVVR